MQRSLLQSPSTDFTKNVMSGIENIASSEVTVYQPLISKRAWIIISLFIIGGLGYILMGTGTEGTGWFDQMDFSIISNNKITNVISGITISKTLAYAVGFFGLVFFIQIPMMKHYFDKRFEYGD